MIDGLPALRAAIAALLAAQGARDLGDLVLHADLELAGAPERWSMGSREVAASRFAMIVDAPAFAALSRDPAKLEIIREAFAKAARTPETELAGLSLVLRLPGLARGWHHAYRDAAPRAAHERPEPDAVLGGAASLLEASGDARGAAMLGRALLDVAPVPGAGPVPLVRCVVRLDPADRLALDQDYAAAERLRRAVHDAGTRAAEAVATVELAIKLAPRAPAGTAEARLSAALEARGAVAVPIARHGATAELAVLVGGTLRRVAIAPTRDGDLAWRSAPIRAMTVPPDRLADAEAAHRVAALLCADADD